MRWMTAWKRGLLLLVLAGLILVAGNMLFVVVDETEYVVITRFGEPVRAYTQPGLYVRWPEPIETVHRYDNRLLAYEVGEIEFLPEDKKNIVIDSYVVWRIQDPIEFLKTVKDEISAEGKLRDIVTSELGIAIGNYELASLVSTEPQSIQLESMVDRITQITDTKIQPYGMHVEDVRLKVINFPSQNKEKVFRRMRAERERIARQYRSEGNGEAERIRAQADEEREKIISAAYREAEQIKGEGDAEALRIYAEAYQKDPRFYELTRTLEAYQQLIDDSTTVVLPTDSQLLKYLNSPSPEEKPKPARTAQVNPRETPPNAVVEPDDVPSYRGESFVEDPGLKHPGSPAVGR